MANSSVLRSARPVFSVRPAFVFFSLWQNRRLVKGLVKRDVMGRYRGSLFGVFWSLVQPLVMLAIYTLVFSEILQTKWSRVHGTADFALSFFIGLIVFNFFAECVNRSPALVLNNPNFVKKVVFPLETLSWMAIGSALFHLVISFAAWLLFALWIRGTPPWTALWLPMVLLPLMMCTLGFTWFLASLGVFVRDANQAVGLLTSGLMFLSPIFYEALAVPEKFRWLLYLNPLTFPIEQARRVLLDGSAPDPIGYLLYLGAGVVVAWAGLAWFQRTRGGFADVI
jgi:lipopolysaccharide transport system permease protein